MCASAWRSPRPENRRSASADRRDLPARQGPEDASRETQSVARSARMHPSCSGSCLFDLGVALRVQPFTIAPIFCLARRPLFGVEERSQLSLVQHLELGELRLIEVPD